MSQPDTLAPFALTTRGKVKSRLGISSSDTSSDSLIDDIINQTSQLIQNMCNRQFLQQSYDEQYDTEKRGEYLFLRQLPVATDPAPIIYIRGGNINSPTWTVFNNTGYYATADYLKSGMIRFTGAMLPTHGRQLLRCVYTAGYLIDFTAEFDSTKHTLPFDLTMLATDLATKAFNHRSAHGIAEEQIEGQKQTYDFDLEDVHRMTINKYSKPRLTI